MTKTDIPPSDAERQEIAAETVTKKPEVIDLSKLCGRQKVIGGSMSDDWNNVVADQTTRTLWFFENSDAEQIQRDRRATVEALIGIKPGDELEGMMAAQLRCHNAAMMRRRGGEPANSTICSAVKPCANRTASLQPSCVHEASSFDRAPLCWAREPTSGRGAPA
jgi:hypothetical protein